MKNSVIYGDEKAKIRRIDERPPRAFAVGDIHGCHAELSALLNFLKSEQGASPEDHFIFIGDYIDRGPQSREVIETLLQFKAAFPKTSFLRGNHEDMLMGFLGLGGQGGEFYLSNGGAEFFKSYGIEPHGPVSRLRENLPTEHLDFFKSLELGVSLGEFLFVHAGINPNLGIDEQRVRDLMWVRAEFVRNPHNLGKTVVFGHTPFDDVLLDLPYKIGIDTGVVYGNRLSAVELVHGSLFQVERGDTEVRVSSLRDRLDSGSD